MSSSDNQQVSGKGKNLKQVPDNTAVLKKTRRAARELTLNILYQCDLGVPFDEALPVALKNANLGDLVTAKHDTSSDARTYAEKLARGVREQRVQLDAIITGLARDWSLDRQPNVDRNVLRIALYEIINEPDVPDAVSIDEAIELANLYSTDDSGKFVNGVLAGYLRSRKS
jgi:N utilization substance protein B